MKEQAEAILTELGEQHGTAIVWPSPATKSRAYAFANEQGHSLNPSKSCPACDAEVIDIVRKAAGLQPMVKEARARVILARKQACRGGDGKTAIKSEPCPAYHEGTDSCGRLILDAFISDPIEVDGRMIQPCGCRLFGVFGKGRMEGQTCPANRWNP